MRRIKTSAVGIVLLVATAFIQAQATAIVDDFSNGIVTNSDSAAGFWQLSGSASESNSAVILTAEYQAGGTTHPKSTILSSSVDAADFWSGLVSVKAEGISCSATTGLPTYKQQLRLGITAHTSATSMYGFEDAIALLLRQDGLLRFGYSTSINENPSSANNLLETTVTNPAGVDSIELLLDGSGPQLSWKIILGRNGVFESYSGIASEIATSALRNAWSVGQSRLALESQLGGGVNDGDFNSVSADSISSRLLATVVQDDFNNGIAEDSDTLARFWDVSGTASEAASSLTLRSEYLEGGSASPKSTILSADTGVADFWSGPVAAAVNGISFDATASLLAYKQQVRMGFTAKTTVSSMYGFEDVIALLLRQDGLLRFGYSTTAGENPSSANNLLETTVTNAAGVDSIEIQLDGSGLQLSWRITLGRSGIYETYSGTMSEVNTAAFRSAWNGDTRIALESQLSSAGTVGDYSSFSADEVSVRLLATTILDDFNNGTVEDSDTSAGFWQTSGIATEAASTLTLRAEYLEGGSTSPKSTVLSSSTDAANFWSGPVSVILEGLGTEASAGLPAYKQQMRLGFTAHTDATSMYGFEDVIALLFRQNGALRFGYSTAVNETPELGTNLLDITVADPASVDSIELRLDGSGAQLGWEILLGRAGVYESHNGLLSESQTTALWNSWNVGQTRVAAESHLGGGISTGDYTSVSADWIAIVGHQSGAGDLSKTLESALMRPNAENLIWTSGFEEGCFRFVIGGRSTDTEGPLWAQAQYQDPSYFAAFTNQPVRCGSEALRLEWRASGVTADNDSKKAMIHFGKTDSPQVTDRWYGFSMYLPSAEFPEEDTEVLLFQLHATPDYDLGEPYRKPPLSLNISNGVLNCRHSYDLAEQSPHNSNIDSNEVVETVGSLTNLWDQWTDFVVHARFSLDNQGVIEIWQDGTQIIDLHDINLGYNDAIGPYPSWGIYCYDGTGVRAVLVDEVRIGDENSTYEDVAPGKLDQTQIPR